MKIRFLGHSVVELSGSKRIYIDPFLTGNDQAAIQASEITEADFVACTHDHMDHLGDSFAICKATGATFVGAFELADMAAAEGIEVEPMGIGGTIETGGIRFSLVNATHSSSASDPTGVIVEMDGKTVYHMGDTGLTADMGLLPEFFEIDITFVPVGDRFTMGARSAVKAVQLCQAKLAVPVHYATFPIIEPTAEKFVAAAQGKIAVKVMEPGEEMDL